MTKKQVISKIEKISQNFILFLTCFLVKKLELFDLKIHKVARISRKNQNLLNKGTKH